MPKEKNKGDLQKKYLELQLLIKQINDLQQQLLLLQQQILGLRELKENISKFKDLKSGVESYIPLGSNIFAKAKLIDNKEFLVGVGSNTFIKKTIDETLELIEKQTTEIEKIMQEFDIQINELDSKGHELQEEIVKLSKQ